MCKVHVQSSKQNYYAQKYWIETTHMQQYAFLQKGGGELQKMIDILILLMLQK